MKRYLVILLLLLCTIVAADSTKVVVDHVHVTRLVERGYGADGQYINGMAVEATLRNKTTRSLRDVRATCYFVQEDKKTYFKETVEVGSMQPQEVRKVQFHCDNSQDNDGAFRTMTVRVEIDRAH